MKGGGGAWGAETPPPVLVNWKSCIYISYVSSQFQLCNKNLTQFSLAPLND